MWPYITWMKGIFGVSFIQIYQTFTMKGNKFYQNKLMLASPTFCLCLLIFLFSPPRISTAGAQSVTENITNIGSYPILKTATTYGMLSSYDRTGGNDDGFTGKYSVIRQENGNSVVAELEGKGMITRIWFPLDRDKATPMFLDQKRIFIYLDGNSAPAIDIPVVDLFNNSGKYFPFPLCGMALGGCWCNTPIAFNNGAKIVIEGEKVGFIHVQYNQYPKETNIKTFSFEDNSLVIQRDRIMDILWNLGDIDYLELKDTIAFRSIHTLKPGENTLSFPEGGKTLRAFIVNGEALDLSKFLEGRLQITWDDGKSPAIDVPLSMFFIQEKSGLNGKSLLAGVLPTGDGVYNFFPMPYQKKARVKLIVPQQCKVKITTLFEPLPRSNPNLCYFHTSYQKNYPTQPGKKHQWLDVKGRGQYMGVYMRAEGQSLSGDANGTVYWTGCLEGDEVFEVDGKMIQHGTGTEDYFNAGWNGLWGRLDHAQDFPFHGYTLFNAGKKKSSTAAYRWHLPTEVIPFDNHIRATIEVGPVDDYIGNYESVAYYYLTTPNKN